MHPVKIRDATNSPANRASNGRIIPPDHLFFAVPAGESPPATHLDRLSETRWIPQPDHSDHDSASASVHQNRPADFVPAPFGEIETGSPVADVRPRRGPPTYCPSSVCAHKPAPPDSRLIRLFPNIQ